MSAQRGGGRTKLEIQVDTTRDQALEFLAKLRDDTAFRADYETNPARVLKKYGVTVKGKLPPVKAPPRAQVRAVHAELAEEDSIFGWSFMFLPFISFGGLRHRPPRVKGTDPRS